MARRDNVTEVMSKLNETEKIIISHRIAIANNMKALFGKSPFTDIKPFAAALKLPALRVVKIIAGMYDVTLFDLAAMDAYNEQLESSRINSKKLTTTAFEATWPQKTEKDRIVEAEVANRASVKEYNYEATATLAADGKLESVVMKVDKKAVPRGKGKVKHEKFNPLPEAPNSDARAMRQGRRR